MKLSCLTALILSGVVLVNTAVAQNARPVPGSSNSNAVSIDVLVKPDLSGYTPLAAPPAPIVAPPAPAPAPVQFSSWTLAFVGQEKCSNAQRGGRCAVIQSNGSVRLYQNASSQNQFIVAFPTPTGSNSMVRSVPSGGGGSSCNIGRGVLATDVTTIEPVYPGSWKVTFQCVPR